MDQRIDWLKALTQCKINIQEQIAPFLKTLKKPQPNLGIGAGGDPIREVDIAAENAIVDTLQNLGISFTLISEESGVKAYGKDSLACFVIADPIDGTTNLMRGIGFYATSIAVSESASLNGIFAALVADLPTGTMYLAQKGRGSFREDQRISPSKRKSLEDAVIGVDLNSYRVKRIVPRLTSLIRRTGHIRHFGANALELCYVADGTIDAFIDIRGKLRITDVAAALLIIEEAGALMTTDDGKPLDAKLSPKQKVEFVAAANKTIHEEILDLIRSKKAMK